MAKQNSTTTALVTGASLGIGSHFARFFAESGCNLVLVARSGEKLEALARELHQKHLIKVKVISKDLSRMESVADIAAELEANGTHIDYLVNNAGFGEMGFFKDTPWDKEYRMIQLNITALTFMTKIFAPKMVARGSGRILNVASMAAFLPGPKMAVYYATKAYVLSFSEALANELQGTGVTVTALCPGPTKSGFQEAAHADQSKVFSSPHLPTAEQVARYGYQAMMKGKTVAIHGWMNSLGAHSLRLMPRKLVTRISRMVSEA